MSKNLFYALLGFSLLAVPHLNADVSLPRVFSDNMVLQQQSQVNIWGSADPGEHIDVTGSWDGTTVSTEADASGAWRVQLTTIAGDAQGTPYTLTVEANNTITFSDVVMGEVWLLGGQSNMELPLSGWGGNDPAPVEGSDEAIAAANIPNLRLFWVGNANAATPQDTIPTHWTGDSGWRASTSSIVPNFSALGFFFGREIHEELQVPVGLIQDCWGGSSCEAWTPQANLNRVKEYNDQGPWEPNNSNDNQTPSVLFNAMIHPVIPFTLRGVLWYQGETNMGRMEQLSQLFPEMIQGWRSEWGQDTLPFCFALLAPYDYWPGQLPEFWESQASALYLPNTGMVVTQDLGDLGNIHPAKKEPVGHRMALWARSQVYGEDIVYSGPIYRSMSVEGSSLRLSFDHVGSGLKAAAGGLEHFEIAAADGNFVDATAVIDGNDVIVSAPSVTAPTQARYGWSKEDVPGLYNEEDLPAAPFRTQPADYDRSHMGAFYRPEAVTSTGLFTQNGLLHDATNDLVTPYGVSIEIAADEPQAIETLQRQIDELTSLTDSNSVVIMRNLPESTDIDLVARELDLTLSACVQANLVPVIGLMQPESAGINAEAELWTEPAILEVLRRYGDYATILLSSPGAVETTAWATQVNTAVETLRTRNQGTSCMLVIECAEYGTDPSALLDQYAQVSDNNLLFAIVPDSDELTEEDINNTLDQLMAQRIPVIIGGIRPGSSLLGQEIVDVMFEACQSRGIPYILSSWESAYQGEPSLRADGDEAALSTPWGTDAILGDNGVNQLAVVPSVYSAPMDFSTWTAIHGVESQGSANPDNDAFENRLEYFHGTHPAYAEKTVPHRISQVSGQSAWTLRISDDARDNYKATIFASRDLSSWLQATLSYNSTQSTWELDAPEGFPAHTDTTLIGGIWHITLEPATNHKWFLTYLQVSNSGS